tara:strand:+ start:9014 stop:9229 length:216 start_codon:yes stop_codon:yes gene_type:complete
MIDWIIGFWSGLSGPHEFIMKNHEVDPYVDSVIYGVKTGMFLVDFGIYMLLITIMVVVIAAFKYGRKNENI